MDYFKYLPFLDDKDLNELTDKILNKEVTEVPLYSLFPFISNATLEKIVDHLIKEDDGGQLTKTLPFLSSDSLDKIKQAMDDGTLTTFDESRLLPFMDSSSIKDLFYAKLKKERDQTKEK